MGKEKTNPTPPVSPRRTGANVICKRLDVGHPSQPRAFCGLPSVPQLPPEIPPSPPVYGLTPQNNPPPCRYSSPTELHDKSMREHPRLFATAPWFCDLGVRDTVNIDNTFADGASMLPGYLPLMAIQSYDWRARIAIPPYILRSSSPQGRHAAPQGRHVLSARSMSTVCDRLELPLTDGPIHATFFVTPGNTVRRGSGLT